MINVVSVRVGTKYPIEYVTKLHDGIARHLDEEQRHWCLTDRPDELPEGITAIAHNPDLPGWWQKVYLHSFAMPWMVSAEVLYMDLDVCVTGRLEACRAASFRTGIGPAITAASCAGTTGNTRTSGPSSR